MHFSLYLILIIKICLLNSQWIIQDSLLIYNEIFQNNTGINAYWYFGGYLLPSTTTTANFITCKQPSTSYLTLTQSFPSAQYFQNSQFNLKYFLQMDLFFQGTWISDIVTIRIGAFSYQYQYTSPANYTLTSGFCDDIPFEVRTVNLTSPNSFYGEQKLTSLNNQGQVSIRNFFILRPLCYPSCVSCVGPKFNQCTKCYYGVPTNNICPHCPSNKYYMKYQGCKDSCDITSQIQYQGFCQDYQVTIIQSEQFSSTIKTYELLKWSIVYDSQNVNPSPKLITISGYSIFGIFTFKSGVYKSFNLNTQSQTFLIGLKINIVLFNQIPMNCGIQFKINNTYYGSIYRNISGIQTHKLKIYETYQLDTYQSYISNYAYVLITYLDIPQSKIIFQAVGNYTTNNAGWGVANIQFTSGYCPQNCLLCEVSFKCKTCANGYYFYREGTCIAQCLNSNQKLIGSYCYDYDYETKYSQYLIQEFKNSAFDVEQYQQYKLVSQSGTNFLKGQDIYVSVWQGMRVFGGPFIWAQAIFQRIYDISNPHYSVTIGFIIIYGPAFPSDGRFIYTIENNTPVSKSNEIYSSTFSDGSKSQRVYERIDHNTTNLQIIWECFGPNNEPIYAYCGIYQYYISVHYCQPYCLECSDWNICLTWNSTYDQNIVRFSQEECLSNQYFDRDSFRCLECPYSCLTCISKIDCQSCQSNYVLTKLGCVCRLNQYEYSNQCFDCPIECNQCLTFSYCIECLVTNYRQLEDGSCNCIQGYYPIQSNPQCQKCHQFCKTCFGPTSNDCLACSNITLIEQVGQTCRCPTGSYYQGFLNKCQQCHQSCQTCFRTNSDGCLSCNSTQNRILKGVKCECIPGYYELNDVCTNCPQIEETNLTQFYKQCTNNLQIWHSIICNSCDSGFQLVLGECQPSCGDLQIKGYEQCEDNNTNLTDLCYNCQFQCPVHCQTCDQLTTLPCPDICGDGIITGIEDCEDGNSIQYDGCFNCQYQCQPQCTKCIKGECQECLVEGWQIDPKVKPWKCKEICGDLIKVGVEQCEDDNYVDTNGCKDCQYYCRIGCSSCDFTKNICLSCELPGFTPYLYYCKNVCGDGLVVTDPSGFNSELCDDGNTTNYDGCSNTCQFQCQSTQICQSCVNNRCQVCAPGYYLSKSQICNPPCEINQILPYKGCQNYQSQCQTSCLVCDTTGLGCLKCKSHYNRIDNLCYSICGDRIVTDDEQCDDGNLIYGDGCHFCSFTCQDSCLNCIKGNCHNCQQGYQLIQSKCYPICGDGVQVNFEQCEISDQLLNVYGCIDCKLKCDLNCRICQFGVCQLCQFGYVISQNTQICQQIDQQNKEWIQFCEQQIENSYVKCVDSAQLDKLQQTCTQTITSCCLEQTCLQNKTEYYEIQYIPQLVANMIIKEENCNYLIGQVLNKNIENISKCNDSCIYCINGQCFLCLEGSYLFNDECIQTDIYNQIYVYVGSVEQCGDSKINIYEECEDNNNNPFDGCFNCKFQCDFNCIDCLFGKCKDCQKGYVMNKNFICEPECGDGLIVPFSDEQCDVQDEGCFNCKFICQLNCLKCNLHQCFECETGYQLDQFQNNLCKLESFCGDGIIDEKFEDCDDQNEQPYDGCFKCKFQCQLNCQECQNGVCQEEICPSGAIWKNNSCTYLVIQNCDIQEEENCKSCISTYDLIDNQCVLQNDLKSNTDINQTNDYQNHYENQNAITSKNYLCRQNQCFYSKIPQMSLLFLNQKFDLQFIQINFDQQVKLNGDQQNQEQVFSISILNLDQSHYFITLQPIQDFSFDLQFVQYEVIIKFLISLENKPILQIQLNQDITNQYNQKVENYNYSIRLSKPTVISEQERQSSIQMKNSNKGMMIGAISISVICLFSGQGSIFVETINFLQYQSFLRFINVEYPENLYIYFQAQEMLTIDNYLEFLNIHEYLEILTKKDQPIQSNGKFRLFNIDADLFTNLSPQYLQVISIVTLLIFYKKLYPFLLQFNILILNKFQQLSMNKSHMALKILSTLIKQLLIHLKLLINWCFSFSINSIRSFFQINSWDLLFKVILCCQNIYINNIRALLSVLIAGSILCTYIYFINSTFSQCVPKKKFNRKLRLDLQFTTFDLCRTITFHIFLIALQNQPTLQCLFLSINNLFYCIIIYKYYQCDTFEKITLLINEGLLSIYTLTSLLYIQIANFNISPQDIVNVGFFHMYLLLFTVGVTLFKQSLPFILKILQNIKKKWIKRQRVAQIFI